MQTFFIGTKMLKHAHQTDSRKMKVSVDIDDISPPPKCQKRVAWDVEKSCKPALILAYLQATAFLVENTRILYMLHPQQLPA
ncbi:hypothetical protein HMPREF2140_03150 [Hoylesella buccalis DNF00985]|nr:hypothetical protein HMPREF2140_03150 [Hoylesella buccalis DNF00985]